MKPAELEALLTEAIPEDGTITTDLLADKVERACLAKGGAAPDRRTLMRRVQRALDRLAEKYKDGICLEPSKPHRWTWKKGKRREAMLNLDPTTALSIVLIRRHLDCLMPEPHRSELEPLFQKAQQVLANNQKARWVTRTSSTPSAFTLPPPEVNPEVLRQTQQALLDGTQLILDYRKPFAEQARQHTLHPQGLVLCDGVIYLIALVGDREEPTQFVLHRAQAAQATTQTARAISGFDASRFVSTERGLQFLTGKTCNLRLRVSGFLAVILTERPLAEDQTIKSQSDGRSLVTATLPESEQIEWWLSSWGSHCEVIAPKRLRDAMAKRVKEMHSLYFPQTEQG